MKTINAERPRDGELRSRVVQGRYSCFDGEVNDVTYSYLDIKTLKTKKGARKLRNQAVWVRVKFTFDDWKGDDNG